jgi:hypothetical protein
MKQKYHITTFRTLVVFDWLFILPLLIILQAIAEKGKNKLPMNKFGKK